MIRAQNLVSLAALLLAWGPLTARAAEQSSQPYVVLVGIDHYKDRQILPRRHAEADARALYDLFVAKKYLGVDDQHIRLLLGSKDTSRSSRPATRDNILKALKWLQTSAARDDLVIFAFFGQGAPMGERLCFFASDSTFKGRHKNGLASGDFEGILDKLKSQRFISFVDVHFLGFKSKKPPSDPNVGDMIRIFMGKEDDKGVSSTRAAFFANNGIKPSVDLKDHGIFAKVLIDGLKGKADVEGYEPDGLVTVEELGKYIKKELPALARAVGKNDIEKDQLPGILESRNSDFLITLNPAAYPRAHQRLLKFDKLAQDQKLAKEVAEEGHNLLSRMPKLEAKQNLRKAYQKFVDGDLTLAAFKKERKEILAGTRLSKKDADTFARMVMRAAAMVRQDYVKEVNEGQLVDFAVRGLFRIVNEKIPSAIRERLENAKTMKDPALLKLLTDARMHLGKREDLAAGKDITFSLHFMLGKLDKHTDYIDPETLNRFKIDIEGKFTGIGVQIKKNNIRDELQVVTPIKDTPAYKAMPSPPQPSPGLWAGDIITTIVREVDSNGNPLPQPEILPTKGMTTDQAVKKIIGREGTKVKLIVEREGVMKPLEFTLIRGRVEVETVLGNKRQDNDTWDYVIDPENRICYVRLTQFSYNTYRDLERAMRQLSKAGIKGFILDLRFNPGGLLDSAVKISDLFIDDGTIVTIRPRNGPVTSYVGRSDGSYTAFPMVCLVNGFSASASEIVSACLQDNNRAMVMGTRSYGKGSVQTIHNFATGGRLKLTTATFWRPISDPETGKGNLNKASTQGREEDIWGVTPNAGFILKLSTKEENELQDHQRDREIIRRPDRRHKSEGKTEFHDRQLEMALDYLRTQIKTAAKANGKKAG